MANMTVGLGADDWQWLPDLLFIDNIAITSPTTFSYSNRQGHTVAITGSGFTYDGNEPTGGTLTTIKIVDGAESVLSVTGASTALGSFADLVSNGDATAAIGLVLDGDDTINGTPESNSLGGYSAGDDIVDGGGSDDFIQGDEGDDQIDGGGGWDALGFAHTSFDKSLKKGIVLKVASGTVKDPWGGTDTFENMESYWATANKDKLTGSDGDEEFIGLRGDDKIDGKGGRDQVDYSQDVEYGGNKGIKVDFAKGTVKDGFGDTDRLKSIEVVRGTERNDIFTGGKGNEEFDGYAGKDKYNGGKGFDFLVFFSNNFKELRGTGVEVDIGKGKVLDDGYGNVESFKSIESVTGSDFADTLIGSKRDDELKGQNGNDTMTGGKGADAFVFNNAPDSITNHDVITDFSQAEGDRFIFGIPSAFPQLNEVDGGLDPSQFVANPGGNPTNADHRVVYDTLTGKLFLDPDGNATSGDQNPDRHPDKQAHDHCRSLRGLELISRPQVKFGN